MRLNQLRSLITRHADGGATAALEGVLVSLVEEPGPPATSTTGTSLALIAQGAKTLVLGDRIYQYRAGQYLVASVELPVTGQFTEAGPDRPALGFGLTLRPSVIAELLLNPAAGDLPPVGRGAAAPSARSVSRNSPSCQG
jgi:hypothetical protein